MRALPWTFMRRIYDQEHGEDTFHGRHRAYVSSTHRPAWPFNRKAS